MIREINHVLGLNKMEEVHLITLNFGRSSIFHLKPQNQEFFAPATIETEYFYTLGDIRRRFRVTWQWVPPVR